MKIITWNCNLAFRKKAALILAYHPDIIVVPEFEHPDKINFDCPGCNFFLTCIFPAP